VVDITPRATWRRVGNLAQQHRTTAQILPIYIAVLILLAIGGGLYNGFTQPGNIGNLLVLGVIGLDPGFSFTVLDVVGIGGGLLFVAAVADGLGASPARE